MAMFCFLHFKGHKFSEWIFEVVALPKIWSKKFEKFCPDVLWKVLFKLAALCWASGTCKGGFFSKSWIHFLSLIYRATKKRPSIFFKSLIALTRFSIDREFIQGSIFNLANKLINKNTYFFDIALHYWFILDAASL